MSLIKCSDCGKEVSNTADICPGCGKKLNVSPMAQISTKKHFSIKLFSNQKKMIVFSVLLIAFIILICSLIDNRKIALDLTPYVVFEENGYDGYGEMYAYFDSERFYSDMEQLIRPRNNINPRSFVDNVVSGQLSYYDNHLSNGQVVEWIWDCDTVSAEKDYRCILNCPNIQHKITGLSQCTKFDPFKDFSIGTTGMDSQGHAFIEKTQNEIPLKYSLSMSDGLSNGDKITIYIIANNSYDSEYINEYCARNYGMLPKSNEKEITINNLPYYAKSIGDFKTYIYHNLLALSDDVIESEKSNLDRRITIKEYEPIGYKFYVKNGKAAHNNVLFVLSKIYANFTDDNGESVDFEYYYGTSICDITLNPSDPQYFDYALYKTNTGFGRKIDSFCGIFSGCYVEGYQNLNDVITLLNNKYSESQGLVLQSEKNFTSDLDKKVELQGQDATELLYCQHENLGYYLKDMNGNEYDTVIQLYADDGDAFILEEKYKKLKGSLCLKEGSTYDVYIRFCGFTQSDRDASRTQPFYDSNKIIYEALVPASGEIIPYELDVSNYQSVGIFAKFTVIGSETVAMMTNTILE